MQPFIIAPSLLSADAACLGQESKSVLAAGADWIHVDIMDNHYVPNLSFGPLLCSALRKYGIKAPLDVHLMVKPVDALITAFAKAGANVISFHPEASNHVDRSLQLIRDEGCQVGLALNPATPLNILPYVLEKLDLILLMSVNPGFAGQSFMTKTVDKIQEVRRCIEHSGRDIRLEVDGGINVDNIQMLARAGADTFVAGSAIFETKDYKTTIRAFREQLKSI